MRGGTKRSRGKRIRGWYDWRRGKKRWDRRVASGRGIASAMMSRRPLRPCA